MTVGVLSVECTEGRYNSGVIALPEVLSHHVVMNRMRTICPALETSSIHDFTMFHLFFNCLSHFIF